MSAVLEKAKAGGISAPAPGPEPKLEDIIAEIERERLFDIIRELVKWENLAHSSIGSPPPEASTVIGNQ
jgi:putative DNA methylase